MTSICSGCWREKASRRWVSVAPAHPLVGAADAGQQVVEVGGDAGGELADRIHLLRLAQALLGDLAPHFLVAQPGQRLGLAMGPTRRHHRQGKQHQGRRHAEDQVLGHAVDPVGADGLQGIAMHDIDRQVGQPAVGEQPADAVERRLRRLVEAGLRGCDDGAQEARLGRQAGGSAAGRVAHQELAIGADDGRREVAALRCLGELLQEIARLDGDGDHAGEATVHRLPALAVLEEGDVVDPPAQGFADEALGRAVAMGRKVGAVAVGGVGRHGIDIGRRHRMALLVEHPDVLDLRQRIDQVLQRVVDRALVGAEGLVGSIVEQFGHVGRHQDVDLEGSAHVDVQQIERTADALFGLPEGVTVGQPGGAEEEQQRHQKRRRRPQHRGLGGGAPAQTPDPAVDDSPRHRRRQPLPTSEATNFERSAALYGLGKMWIRGSEFEGG